MEARRQLETLGESEKNMIRRPQGLQGDCGRTTDERGQTERKADWRARQDGRLGRQYEEISKERQKKL